VYDHFHTTPVPSAEATHEAWTRMAAFAAVTDRVRLGQMCTCMGYRNPAYLAKVAATVDLISGGRAEMGIGGGWYEHEWRAYG
ncbi:LLM class flavin-dependent oxidoreductase, partial [Acinetobacter baumannii]